MDGKARTSGMTKSPWPRELSGWNLIFFRARQQRLCCFVHLESDQIQPIGVVIHIVGLWNAQSQTCWPAGTVLIQPIPVSSAPANSEHRRCRRGEDRKLCRHPANSKQKEKLRQRIAGLLKGVSRVYLVQFQSRDMDRCSRVASLCGSIDSRFSCCPCCPFIAEIGSIPWKKWKREKK